MTDLFRMAAASPYESSSQHRHTTYSSPLSGAPPLIMSLPLDLLQLILDFLPRRPRTLVCSRVCKRWRTVALRTVSAFTLDRPLLFRGSLGLLPALTDLSIDGDFSLRGVTLPATLRALRIARVEACLCDLFKPLHRLSLLQLELLRPCACWHKVIARNASTLESLALAMSMPDLSRKSHRALAGLSLPHLRRLRLTLPQEIPKTDPFPFAGQQALLDRHLSHLVSLALVNDRRYHCDDEGHQLVLNGPMASLRELYLWNVYEPPYLDTLLARAPNLASVALSSPHPDDIVPYLPRLGSLLTHVRLDMEMDLLDSPLFTECRRLHTLQCVCENRVLADYWPIAPQLVHFGGTARAEQVEALGRFTSLRSLCLRLRGALDAPFHCLPPSLASVGLNSDDSGQAMLAAFQKVLSACPRLSHLRTNRFDAATRSALCDAAERAGLVRVTFIHMDESEVVELRAQHQWLEVCVQNDFGHEKDLPPF